MFLYWVRTVQVSKRLGANSYQVEAVTGICGDALRYPCDACNVTRDGDGIE